MNCPHCNKEINPASVLGTKGGAVKSEAKAKASAENGKKGGRPRKNMLKIKNQDGTVSWREIAKNGVSDKQEEPTEDEVLEEIIDPEFIF